MRHDHLLDHRLALPRPSAPMTLSETLVTKATATASRHPEAAGKRLRSRAGRLVSPLPPARQWPFPPVSLESGRQVKRRLLKGAAPVASSAGFRSALLMAIEPSHLPLTSEGSLVRTQLRPRERPGQEADLGLSGRVPRSSDRHLTVVMNVESRHPASRIVSGRHTGRALWRCLLNSWAGRRVSAGGQTGAGPASRRAG
jgi:hypothetical protein